MRRAPLNYSAMGRKKKRINFNKTLEIDYAFSSLNVGSCRHQVLGFESNDQYLKGLF